jgi:mycofactocin system creatininase family protein
MGGEAATAWPDVARVASHDGALLAVPLGATEQHGPHLPLTTDTDIAEALVSGLVARRADVVGAPALAFGSSGEHAGFPGTLSIGQDATELVLVELCRSAALTYPRVLVVSTHGGNAAPVRRAIARLRAEGHDVRAWGPRWGGDAHAGRSETSLMLALAPERVRLGLAAAGATAPVRELLPRMRVAGVRAVSANGVLGDPAGAGAAEGAALLAAAGAELDALLAEWTAAP